ncbi:NFACT RNA binding domain-containing protein [Gracilimonas tropica]|uniref:NFACT RNA binding domain-containing protein n=1 Tax=Gracilimonas tropica TaxID=454600 RepID=UPI00036AD1D7|nr:NFACT RNA binding domain-containing protein [Gracilimonas tropica]
MNYYELIYLNKALKNKLVGGHIEQAVSPYKNFIEFFIRTKSDSYRLCFSTAPGNIALYLDNYRGAKKSNTINFFEELYGYEITNITIPETDRWLYIHFKNGAVLYFRLFSNRANVFWVKDNQVKAVFKEYDNIGDEPPSPQKLAVYKVEEDISRKSTKNKIIGINAMFPRQNIQELIEHFELDDYSVEELQDWVKEVCQKLEDEPHPRLLENGETTLFSEEVLPVKTEQEFEDVNHLILHRYKTYSRNQRLKQQKSSLLKNLKRKIKRLDSGLRNLEQADKGLERAEKYEQWGHLLMAKAHLGDLNKEEIEVEDLYNEGQKVTIPLEIDLDIAENAQRYYKKSAGAERSYEEALKRIPEMEKEKEKAEKLLAEAEAITNLWAFQDWEKEHEHELKAYRNQNDAGADEESLPFHNFKVQGYTVWIGKNAKSNDELVQRAHKEDVWMHARGVPGSHLVIRMGNEKEMPPRAVLLEAASYAAYNSKAKGMKLAPVIITKKKYVRKPKGSAPGAVVVDKEEVEMVTPKNPVV